MHHVNEGLSGVPREAIGKPGLILACDDCIESRDDIVRKEGIAG